MGQGSTTGITYLMIYCRKILEYYSNHQLRKMMVESYDILNNHPINIEREKKGLNKANLYGFEQRTEIKLDFLKASSVKSYYDICCRPLKDSWGANDILMLRANGSLNTNYEVRQRAAIKALLRMARILYISMLGHQTKWDTKEA